MSFVYRIRHTQTKDFKLGGMWPRWSKDGKTWDSIRNVKLHLRMFSAGLSHRTVTTAKEFDFEHWEVVRYKVTEEEVATVDFATFYKLNGDTRG